MDIKVTFDTEELESLLIERVQERFGKPPVGSKYYATVESYRGGARVVTVPDDPPPAPALVEEAGAEKGADDGSD
jgi:hypothetical protein